MKRVWVNIAWIVVLLVAAAPVSSQGNPPETSPLLTDLALVPDSLLTGNGWATVRYVDFEALFVAEGINELRLTADLPTLMKAVPLVGILSRVVVGPEALQSVFATADRMPQVVGFEWVADVNRALEYGAPPETALILAGTFDESAVAAALEDRGFEQAERSGVTIWHRLEDAEVNLQAREIADPFGGNLGMAARIAILPGHLANSRYWAMIEDIAATAQHEKGSMAENADYRALAEVVTASDGWLIQAMFFLPEDIGRWPALDSDPTASYGPLMPYTLAVMADRQEGNDQVHVIGLVYADTAQAQAAADEVAARISAFSLPQQPGEVLVERFGAQVTASVYESEDAGNAVAVVTVRYPLPAERIDPGTNQFIAAGRLYRAWMQAINQRAFSPLVITAE